MIPEQTLKKQFVGSQLTASIIINLKLFNFHPIPNLNFPDLTCWYHNS